MERHEEEEIGEVGRGERERERGGGEREKRHGCVLSSKILY